MMLLMMLLMMPFSNLPFSNFASLSELYPSKPLSRKTIQPAILICGKNDSRKVELTKWNYGRLGNNFISADTAMLFAWYHGCNLQLPSHFNGLNGYEGSKTYFCFNTQYSNVTDACPFKMHQVDTGGMRDNLS